MGYTEKKGFGRQVRLRMERHIFPEIGKEEIGSITGPRVLEVLRKIEAKGRVKTAHNLRISFSQVFRFAIAEGKAERDPCPDIRNAQVSLPDIRHFRSLTTATVPEFFAALATEPEDSLNVFAQRWVMMTWTRSAETRFARRSEIDGDIWRIPPSRMKKRREHIVALPRQAVELLPRIYAAGGDSEFLFPCGESKTGVISEHRMLKTLDRIGVRDRTTVHGIRSLASTWANDQTREDENGDLVRRYDSDWIELQLAHVERNAVRGAYNSAEWASPRRRVRQAWADWLDQQEAIGMLLG